MTIPLTVGDVLEVRLQCEFANQTSQNVLHYGVSAIVNGPISDQETADLLSSRASPLYRVYLYAEAEYVGLRLQKVSPAPKATYVTSVVGAGVGEVASPTLPTQACGGIVKLTALAERRYRGFVFLPFMTEADNDEGKPNPGAISTMGDWAAGLLEPFTLNGATADIDLIPIIYSLGDGIVAPVTAPIIDYRLQPWWVTHKSRALNRRGDILGP